MGLFNKLGRKVEQFKQEVNDAKEANATHRCLDCGELLYGDVETCPECGAESVIPIED